MHKILVFFFALMLCFFYTAEGQVSEQKQFGISQFSTSSDSFDPIQSEKITISGYVFNFSTDSAEVSPSITIMINAQQSLPVTLSPGTQEPLNDSSFTKLSEWSFSAVWDGKDTNGVIVPSGEYNYTITLDLPNAGKDTKTGVLTVNAAS